MFRGTANYIEGVASAIEIFPDEDLAIKKLLERTNEEAIREDWVQVGKDIEHALNHYGQEQKVA